MKRMMKRIVLISMAVVTLGGCAAYTEQRPKLAYFIVPCGTPGAFSAQPVNTADDNASPAPQDLVPEAMKTTDAASKEANTCLIAASTARPYNPAYNGYGFAPYYPYPRYYGSGIGVSLHGGGHRSSRHGGHRRH
ncbi:MAG TPA: hypothetical protein PLJ45_10895 [Sphingorhabdus sp.]|uniref:hypothetical protein n=1 Tax=Sphingorhabdus sp. TaxID=1902408 RepID=UPI0026AB1891|nr:hypothetical protein [Sphingorhabdus sp.]HQS13552.1 hypothetical protein [Sphingorhabdus sp.]HQS80781.1 hypothetical protein [Sphingorhabdus sp.]